MHAAGDARMRFGWQLSTKDQDTGERIAAPLGALSLISSYLSALLRGLTLLFLQCLPMRTEMRRPLWLVRTEKMALDQQQFCGCELHAALLHQGESGTSSTCPSEQQR